MIDILTYIPNLEAFRLEAIENAENDTLGFSFNDGELSYNISKIPVKYSADLSKSVCLIRLMTEEEIEVFDSLNTCQRIGIYEGGEDYTFDEGGKALYDSVYDQTPIEIDGETYTPPAMIGVFA